MKSAEDLIALLEQKKLVDPKLLNRLRFRLTGLPASVTAGEFAQRLVEYKVLTEPLANALLQQLGQEPAVPPVPAPPELVIDLAEMEHPVPPPTVQPSAAPPPPSPPLVLELPPEDHPPDVPVTYPAVHPAAVSAPLSLVLEPVHEQNAEQLFRKKHFAIKRKSGNLWDTKLMLFGGAGLLVLCLAGLFLAGSLFRRSAETMFAEADRLYQSASYSPAIAAYSEFLEKFPNHSESSTARIRRALARIRILVDNQTDWSKTLETASQEIETVKDEPKFFEESKAELGILLPKIAAALANEAEEKTSIAHAEHAEKAIALIESVLPSSLRPAEILSEVQFKANRVRRLLVQKDALSETKKKWDALLAMEPFRRSEAEQCFGLLDDLLKEHPELEQDSEFVALRQAASENERRAVRPLSNEEREQWTQRFVQPEEEHPGKMEPAAVLYHRTMHNTAHKNADTETEPNVPLFVYAAGTVFALQSSDGTLLWQQPLRVQETPLTPPTLIPVPKTETHAESVLVVQPSNNTLKLLDGQNGQTLWHLTLKEPFYCTDVAEGTADSPELLFCIASKSGTVLTFSFGASDRFPSLVQGWHLPQNITSAPLFDAKDGLIYQPGGHDTLFVLPLNENEKISSHHTAHRTGSLRTNPVQFGSNILFVRQTAPKSCELQVFSVEERLTLLQSIPVSGLTDTAPVTDGSSLVLTSDSGETSLFLLSDDEKAPLQKIASGSAGGSVTKSGTVRYAALTEKNVWIADWQLMRYEAQRTQSRLLPQESLRQNIITLAPLRKIGGELFHTFRYPNAGGVFLQAVATDSASIRWETELADPPVIPPQIVDEQTLLVYTSGGKSYRLERNTDGTFANRSIDTPATLLPSRYSALRGVIPLKDGFAAWITDSIVAPPKEGKESGTNNRTLMMYDPQASEQTRFRSLLLPCPMTAVPAALNENLLAPLQNGQVALLDPKTGTPVAQPFVPTVSEKRTAFWNQPVCVSDAESKSGEFLVFDESADAQHRSFCYRAALESNKLVLKQKWEAAFPASRIAVNNRQACYADKNNVLYCITDVMSAAQETVKAKRLLFLLTPCVWGPYAVNDTFWAATSRKMTIVSADGTNRSFASPVPVGQPLVEPDGVTLVSASGTVWKYQPATEQTVYTVQTGIATQTGLFRFGEHLVLLGTNGIVYQFAEKPD